MGLRAPRLELTALTGETVALDRYRGRPVLVSFLRHAGRLICRAHLVKVLSQKPRLDDLGATALFVVHDDPTLVRRGLLEGLDVSYPVLVDQERAAYRDWGLRRSSRSGIWLDPRLWGRYTALVARGERPLRLGHDTLQLGGDFIIDPDGIVTYARPQRRDDRPPVSVLVRELRAALTRR